MTAAIERELLERAAALLNPDRSPSALFHQRRDCADAIRAALAAPATAPEHLDPADLCDVCKEPVRYGSRHHACGEAMLRAKANAAPATAPDELERLRQIAHLTGTIFCYGNFVAETHNEAVLEKLLRENGTFWDSVEQYEKSQGWIP